MTIKKVRGVWTVNGRKIPSYELYCVFGQSVAFRNKFGKVRPGQFQPKHVEAYLKAKKNKTGIFKRN